MATTQYKDNAEHIYEFQQEVGDAGGSERRPVAGMPAQVRTQLAEMAASLAGLAGTVLSGSLKVVIQAGTAVIGKLAPNSGVNIGTVDVASGTIAIGGSVPVGTNHIGSVAVDAALPAGANTIGKVDVNTLPTIDQLPASIGQKTKAASLPVVLPSDQGNLPVSVVGNVALGAGGNTIGKLAANVGVNIGTVDLNNALQLPPSLGQRNKATSLGVTIASDQGGVAVNDGGSPLMVIGAGGNPLPVSGTVTVGNTVAVNIGTSLPAGANHLGSVAVDAALPVGTNNIGTVTDAAPSAAALSVVPASTAPVTLAASNPARVGLIVVNNFDSTSELYVKFGTGASSTSWTAVVLPGGYWEMPRRYYTGVVTGAWVDSSRTLLGDAHVTETA